MTGCTLSPGADSTQGLKHRAIEAIESRDLDGALGTMLDAEPFVKHCQTRLRGDDTNFRRRLDNNRKRQRNFFEQCTAMLDSSIEVLDVSGGRRRKQADGCDNNVWQYSDIVIRVKTGGRRASIRLDGIVAIEGRFYVVERIVCR